MRNRDAMMGLRDHALVAESHLVSMLQKNLRSLEGIEEGVVGTLI